MHTNSEHLQQQRQSFSKMGRNFRTFGNVGFWCFWYMFFCYFSLFCSSADRITSGEFLKDGKVIISSGNKFALGFFSPENSDFRYVGIWFHGIPEQTVTVVWVANREKPLQGSGGTLTIDSHGDLVVLNGNGDLVWSTNASIVARNSSAILTDTGNLILETNHHRGKANKTFWQSFDLPTDVYLPSMNVSFNDSSQLSPIITSWSSDTDPSPGNYSMGVDPQGSPQIVIWEGPNRHWRSGPWNGVSFTGIPGIGVLYLYGFNLVNDGNGSRHFIYEMSNNSQFIYFRLLPNGSELQRNWNAGLQQWDAIQLQPANQCDLYNTCGPFGVCDVSESPVCSCMHGYVPKDDDQWRNGNWSGGCTRRVQLQCERTGGEGAEASGERDGFLRVENVKLPDFIDHVGQENVKQCENKCLQDCSCIAYSSVNGLSCMIWRDDLVDVQQFDDGGSPLFIRLANSELGSTKKVTKLVIIAAVAAGLLLLGVSIWLLWRYTNKFQGILKSLKKGFPDLDPIKNAEFSTAFSVQDDPGVEGQQGSGTELLYLSFSSVVAATNNFSDRNKLGQGGFGHVYKGELPGGQEIAVKRLAGKSEQGLEEFKNEVVLIAKLQHRNLVKLLGCCIEGEEKILLYEYMPNKSLDSFLFDPVKQKLLDWTTRFHIIEGIARGLLYLHRDSRLRIIHRDLKASNVLLDEEMTPKIADFGMARIFRGNQNEANTNRVVGTYGYMAPEYAMEGLFSVKSDVYSFGILLLEIVSGKKNIGFRSADYSSVIGYAWNLWDKGRAMDIVDPSIVDTTSPDELLRCIHIGMLCVQDSASSRPAIPAVLLMLESQNANLPQPKQPSFTSMRREANVDLWNEINDDANSNNVTLSVILGR